MLVLLSAGIAPGLALLSYFYLRDQYNQEPIRTVFKVFLFGALMTFPIMFIQYVIGEEAIFKSGFLSAFFSVALLEEFFKWFILMLAIYQHGDFDEPYDGIVYGTSISLGFATVENILYLVVNGVEFAIGRALFPVSSHALFGVIMGYYMGKAKFGNGKIRKRTLFASFFAPFLLHGLYDYILVSQKYWLYYTLPFMLFLWWLGLRKTKQAHLLTKKHHQKQIFEEEATFHAK